MESIHRKVVMGISGWRRGKLFFPKDLHHLGTEHNVNIVLTRLVKQGLILRLANGIYLYPKRNKILGTIKPTIEEIAVAIAKRDRAKIIPSGELALNKLGLSQQVPTNFVYLTDGLPRTIKIGKQAIKFKKIAPKYLALKGKTSVLAIQALRALGKENIDEQVIAKLKKVIRNEPPEAIRQDAKIAPSWIGRIFLSMIENDGKTTNG